METADVIIAGVFGFLTGVTVTWVHYYNKLKK
jgi:hypothetical protein